MKTATRPYRRGRPNGSVTLVGRGLPNGTRFVAYCLYCIGIKQAAGEMPYTDGTWHAPDRQRTDALLGRLGIAGE